MRIGTMVDWGDLLGAEPGGSLSSVTALVGAGISVDAGLPVAYGLSDEVVRCLVRRQWAARELMHLARAPRPKMLDEHDFIRLETLLLWVGRVFDPQLSLFAFLDDFTVPGGLHRQLAHASRRGLRLATVNFDDLLERALLEQGAQPLTIDAQRPIDQSATGAPVYKLHGARTVHAAGKANVDPGTLLATTEIIAAAHPGMSLNEGATSTLRSLVDGQTLLVAGYSASDDLDVVPSLAAMRPARVVWVDHSDSSPRRLSPPSGRARMPWKRLLVTLASAGVEVVPIRGRTAEVFAALGLGQSIRQPALQPRIQWQPEVRGWARAVRGHDPTGLGLAALLFGELGRYELVDRALAESRASSLPHGRWTAARRTYEQGQAALLREPTDPQAAYALGLRARKRATRPVDHRTAVLAELLLGRAAFLQQHYERAGSHFRAARRATPRRSTEHAHALAWQGRAQVWDGRLKLGLRYLAPAAQHFRARGELEGLLDALEAIGVAQLGLMRLAEAEAALEEAHGLAGALGFADRLFTTSASLAEVKLLAGHADAAERQARSITDKRRDEVADAWAVLAGASLALARFRAAARAARRAIETTTSINRSRVQEHLCDLGEAQQLAGHGDAAEATLRTASACAAEETTLLGGARLTVLEAATRPDRSMPRIATRPLTPAAVVRLADTLERLQVAGCEPVLDRARKLRSAAAAG